MSATLEPNGRLQEALAALVEAEERGETIDADVWAQRFPEVADDLRRFLANQQRFEALAGKRLASSALMEETLGGSAPGPGDRIRYFGDYELVEELARGGMGVVYRARQTSLNREVALKMILAGQFADATEVQRFRREAEAAAALDHPNIIPIYEVGAHEGQQYFTMKLVEGGSLSAALVRPEWRPGSKAQQRRAADLAATLARAVHHAHQRGLLHRDLKPANVLVSVSRDAERSDEDTTPIITDFGLAKHTGGAKDEFTRTGAVVGTPAYMAPEQARANKQLTTAADVYGLGAILYSLLTGQAPFAGKTTYDVLTQVIEREPVPPRQLVPTLNADLETICLKCLNKEPAARYPSAEALADELGRWLRGEPIQARPISRSERLRRWCVRNPVVATLAFALAVLLGAFVAGAALAVRQIMIEKDEGTQRLSRLYVEKGNQAIDAERPVLALPWFQEALRIDGDHPTRTPLHRLRLASVLRQMPRPVHYWEGAKLAGFRPTGQQLFTARGAKLEQWEWPSGKAVGAPAELPEPLVVVRYTPDGKHLVCQTKGYFAVCEAGTGRLLYPPVTLPKMTRDWGEHDTPLVSSDSQRVLIRGSEAVNREVYQAQVRAYDLATGKPLGPLFTHVTFDMGSVVPSPDGRFVATTNTCYAKDPADEYALILWNLETGKAEWKHRFKGGSWGYAGAVAFSPDSRRLAAGTGQEMELFDVAKGEKLPQKTEGGQVRTDQRALWNLAFSADGRRIAAGYSNNTVDLLDSATLALVEGRIMEHGTYPTFSPRRPRLFTTRYGSGDSGSRGSVEQWNAEGGGNLQRRFYLTGYQGGLFFSGDDELVGAFSDRHVQVMVAATGKPCTPPLPHLDLHGHALSPDGRYLLTAGTGGCLWDLAAALDGFHRLPGCASDPASSGDIAQGATVAVQLYPQGRLEVWEAATQSARWLNVDSQWNEVRLEPLGRFAVLLRRDAEHAEVNRLAVLDLRTGKLTTANPLPFTDLFKVRFLPNGTSALLVERHLEEGDEANGSTTLHTLELATGRVNHTVKLEKQYASQVTLSTDGQWLALATRTSKPVPKADEPVWFEHLQVRRVGAKGPPAFTRDLPKEVGDLCFSPDAARLAVTVREAPLEVWAWAKNERLPGDYQHPTHGVGEQFQHPDHVAFSPDGKIMVTGLESAGVGGTNSLRLWDVGTGQPRTAFLKFEGTPQFLRFRPDGAVLAVLGQGKMRLYEVATGLPLGSVVDCPRVEDATWDAQGQALYISRFDGHGNEPQRNIERWQVPSITATDAELAGIVEFLSKERIDSTGGLNPSDPIREAAAWAQAGAKLARLSTRPSESESFEQRVWLEARMRWATENEEWAEALRWAQALNAAEPSSWKWREQQGVLLAALGRFADAEASLTKAWELGGTTITLQRRGEVRGELGRWPEAFADLTAACGDLNTLPNGRWSLDAIRSGFAAGAGDKVREQLRYNLTADLEEGRSAADLNYFYAALLADVPLPLESLLVPVSKIAGSDSSGPDANFVHALLLARAGQHEAAAKALARAEEFQAKWRWARTEPLGRAVAAYVHAAAGRTDQARSALAELPAPPKAPVAWYALQAPGDDDLKGWRFLADLRAVRAAAEKRLAAGPP